MNIERLQTLATFLRTVPAEHFDLEGWRSAGDSDPYKTPRPVSNKNLLTHACGTTGCAVGWACALPVFIKQGLRWKGWPYYKGSDGLISQHWEAVTGFFEISQDTAKHLFSDFHYLSDHQTTPSEVADRIEESIREHLELVTTT